MNKSKQAFKEAIELLREAELEPEQIEALATVERFPGELRRQIAELKAELKQSQELGAASERKVVELQHGEQIRAHLEEKLRVSESRARLLESRVRNLESQIPQAIPLNDDAWTAVSPLSKQCQRIFNTAFAAWETRKAEAALFLYSVELMLKVCRVMADQDSSDPRLEQDLLTACQDHFDRFVPGRYSWKRRNVL